MGEIPLRSGVLRGVESTEFSAETTTTSFRECALLLIHPQASVGGRDCSIDVAPATIVDVAAVVPEEKI
eukprot:scaffold242563_cov17-Prasinocladus_malaysianus.AAC.1